MPFFEICLTLARPRFGVTLSVIFALCAALLVAEPAQANGWTSAGSMSTPRVFHTATLLPDGRVLIVGGAAALRTAEIYNPTSNSWTTTGSLNIGRQGHAAVLLSNGKVLVSGGTSSAGQTITAAETYDPSTGSWTLVTSMNTDRADFPMSLLTSGKVLVAGGYQSRGATVPTNAAEVYDPVGNRWTSIAMPAYRANEPATLLANGQILVTGGDDGYSEYATVEVFDPPSASWLTGTPMQIARSFHGAVRLNNGNVLVAGGFNQSLGALDIAELYNPAARAWSYAASMITARSEPTVSLMPNGRVLVTGGSLTEVYDPVANAWASAGPLSQSRTDHTATALKTNQVLVVGGFDNGDLASAELYTDPTSSPPTISPSTAVVAYGSSSDILTLNLGVQPISSLTLVTQPKHGTASISGTTIGYTPTPGYAGTDSLAYTASNSAGTSAAATVSITVSSPTIALGPVSLPNPQIGVAYSQKVAASGGAAPYSYAVTAGALPGGLSLNASTGVISGTATAVGSASFSVTATDASTGNGPFRATQAYSVTVTALTPPTVSPLSASTGCNTAVSINLADGITGTTTSAAIAGNPSHGTVLLAGTTATYTPAQGYCGKTDSFTYTASNAAGTSAPAIVTVSIGSSGSSAKAYVANYGDGTVSVIDTGTGVVTATVQVGATPDAVVVTPDGAKAYVSNSGSAQVTVFSTVTNAVSKAITVGNSPYSMAMSPDGTHVYVVNSGGRSLSVISTATDSVTNTIPLGNGNTLSAPWSAAVSPDSQTIYVADNGLSEVEVIDAASNTVMGTIPTGRIPYAVALSPDGSRAYVANNFDDTVTVISTAAKANIATIPVGPAPMDLAVSPDGSTLYVDNSNEFKNPDSGTVTVISTATDSVITTVPVGLGPDGVAVTPDGSLVYVVNTDSNSVSVISTATNAVVSAIPVGKYPHGRGIFMGPGSSGSGTNTLAASVLPGGRSVQVGTPATIFATLLNAGTTTADSCGVALAAGAPAALSLAYQTTDPSTNAPTGQPDTPVAIVAGGYQTFLLSFTAGTPLSVSQQPLDFGCSNATPAPSTPGVDTVDLTFSSTPITDMVALAATATHDGTLHLATGQPGAFAVATVNLGAAGGLIASADTGTASLPLSLSLCQTNPSNGQCLLAPSFAVSVSVGQNATPTFSIFATPTAPIAFAPGASRIFVRFKDAAGAAHGSTSVAVVSQ